VKAETYVAAATPLREALKVDSAKCIIYSCCINVE